MQSIRAIASLSLTLLLLSGCETTTQAGAVGATRSQLLLVSSQQLELMAAQSYAKLTSEARAKGVLNTNAALLQRVRAIATRLQANTGIFRPDAPRWQWEVNVIQANQLNAFVMPGGKVMIYSGLIEQLSLTDSEIAFILGHEMAHALREHSREQVSQAVAAQTAIGIGSALLGLGSGASELTNAAYEALVATRFSRTHESEADRIGLELAARSGYDPHAGVSLWQKMLRAESGARQPEFLSSHPAGNARIQQVEALLPVVMPLYEATKRR